MSDSFREFYKGRTGLTVGVKNSIYSAKSKYQQIDIFETDAWGKMLVLDGMVMLSEKDEFVYHEMISHPALCAHRNPEHVLIIGGGDGGTAREVLKHPDVNHIDMVEIDAMVVEACKTHMPRVNRFGDERLTVKIEDGMKFLEHTSLRYDIIIVDGSDPVGPAEGLFSEHFLARCNEHLKPGGFFVAQSESPWVEAYQPVISGFYSSLKKIYGNVYPYLCYIPLYPGGMWSMMMASHTTNPFSDSANRQTASWYSQHGQNLRYFNPDIYRSAFAIPNFAAQLFEFSK